MNKIYIIVLAAVATLTMASCEKVSPIGVLVAGTGVEDRVKMSHLYYQEHKSDFNIEIAENGDYTFLVGADSHVTDDTGRMEEMLQIGLDAYDLFYAHLGDIADTKAEYYINLEKTLDKYKHKYCAKKYKEIPLFDEITEGYNIIPNFFISALVDEDLNYNKEDFNPSKLSNGKTVHDSYFFWERLF